MCFHFRTEWPALVVVVLTSLAIAVPAFGVEAFGSAHISDLPSHLGFLLEQQDSYWLAYSSLFMLLKVVSLGSRDETVLGVWLVVVLSCSVAAKAAISYAVFRQNDVARWPALLSTGAVVVTTNIANLWGRHPYLGQISPTIWHNSTIIYATPFAMALFFSAVRQIREGYMTGRIPLWSFLSTSAKPNYVMAFVPALFLCSVLDRSLRSTHNGVMLILTGMAAIAVLGLQFAAVFASGVRNVSIIISPVGVWSLHSSNIPLSLLLSLAFPLAYTSLYFDRIKDRLALGLSWTTLIIALAMTALLAESGERYSHFNFVWGAHAAMTVLFLGCLTDFARQPLQFRSYFVWIMFCAHLASGVAYYAQIVRAQGYY